MPIEQHVRELVIGHQQVSLKRTYDRYAYVAEKRHALELPTRLRRIVAEPGSNNVKSLRR